MVTVYIKKQQFFKNVDEFGNIFEIEYPTRDVVSENGIITQTYDNYIENGFTKVELDEQYKDCTYFDFNEDLTFNVVKYNTRKQREIIIPRIAELKHLLASQDYQTIKYMQGELTEEKFNEVKKQCKKWRDEINTLEASL